MEDKDLRKLIKDSVHQTFENKFPKKPTIVEQKKNNSSILLEKMKSLVESVILTPKTWLLKTERLSNKTKEAHIKLYKDHLETTNKVANRLEAVNREASDADHSAFRSLKVDEAENKNSVMFHELYFGNISDLASSIHADSLAYMRLARDFGTFDRWQWDFLACCMASREGWAVTYLDPFKNQYINCVVDGDCHNIPLGGIPIIVMDMHSHSYYYDYLADKKTYVFNMLKELAWEIVEGRIIVAEKANLHNLFAIVPAQKEDLEKLVPNMPQNQPPIDSNKTIVPPKPSDISMNDQDNSTTPKKDSMM